LRVKNGGNAKPETNLKKQPYMKKYIITLAVGGAIYFVGCGKPSEDPEALGEGDPATKISDEDKKAAEKLGIKFDPKPQVTTTPEEKKQIIHQTFSHHQNNHTPKNPEAFFAHEFIAR